MNWRIVVATVFLVAGGAIEVLAVVGLCATRDLYDRMHFVGLVAYGEVDRRDFDLRWDVRTPTDAPLAGHRVKIEAQIGAIKQTD